MKKRTVSQGRSAGLDLLRCLSMFLVIVLHIFTHGGLAAALETDTAGKVVSTLAQAAAYPAVDCFVLLSGYLLSGRSFRLARVSRIWCTVAFWSVAVQCAFYILGQETVSLGKTVFMFLPLTIGRYWFVNAYVVMLLASPFLNRLLRDLPWWQMRVILLISTAVFCVSPVLALGNEVFGTQNGFSFPWLCAMYLWGGYIKAYCPRTKGASIRYLGVYVLLCVMQTVWIMGIDSLASPMPVLTHMRNVFMKYTSVPVFGSAICLLMYFRCVEFDPRGCAARLCGWCSPLVFSVYLIHDHPLVREHWTQGRFTCFGELSLVWAVMAAIAAAIGIFAACVAVDWVRDRLFRVLRVPYHSDRISQWLEQKIVTRLKGDL